ncbi:MAG: 2-oxo acid dehydrogenase subunit E2 [Acidobacteria bacterium]|nr:2-oxo acid dehydrogenase subunit E2 [Acidobacteriota bacterium]
MGEIIMPKTGDAMTEGRVVKWYKAEGDELTKGEPVVEIETDKVNLDLEAEESGPLSSILVGEGETAEVGKIIGMIGGEPPKKSAKSSKKPEKESKKPDDEESEESDEKSEKPDEKTGEKKENKKKKTSDETADKPDEKKADAGKKVPAEPEPGRKAETKAPADSGTASGRTKSSPLARRLAKDLGVEIQSIRGSGPSGRVVADDVRKAGSGKPAATGRTAEKLSAPKQLEEKDVPLSGMRRTIARRLGESLGPIPHFFLTIDVDVTELMSLRKQLNEIQQTKTSVNDFVVRAAALSLLHHPRVNASWGDEALRYHSNVDVGIAVATDEGLLTPVVRGAHELSVPAIAARVQELAGRARNRKLTPEEYQNSTFTISNLGMYGIEEFTAIINPPNVAILAVGSAMEKAVVLDGTVAVRNRMKITMSCDHRVIDGAAGAEYLATLRSYLEQPLRLLVEVREEPA